MKKSFGLLINGLLTLVSTQIFARHVIVERNFYFTPPPPRPVYRVLPPQPIAMTTTSVAPVNQFYVVAPEAPPIDLAEQIPSNSCQGCIWIPGYWTWNNQWIWIKGDWKHPPYPGAYWKRSHWSEHHGHWRWKEGHWH